MTTSPAPDVQPALGRRPAVWMRALAWAAVAIVLGSVFLLYTRADLIVDLANQLWTCF